MVGAALARGHTIDHFQRGRRALKLAEIGVQHFEALTEKLGINAAGEALLLAVARTCGDTASLWDKARRAGIPWQRKNWTALKELQNQYSDAVENLVGGDDTSAAPNVKPKRKASRPAQGSAAAPAHRRSDIDEQDAALFKLALPAELRCCARASLG